MSVVLEESWWMVLMGQGGENKARGKGSGSGGGGGG